MQSENDVIITARPCGRGALGGLRAKLVSVGCDGVRVCGGELFLRYHKTSGMRVERNCRASGNKKDPHAVAVMRKRTIVGHVPRKISAACSPFFGGSAVCSLFLADQRQRYHSIMSACARARARVSL